VKPEDLQQRITSNGGKILLNLSGKEVSLEHKKHFFINARDKFD